MAGALQLFRNLFHEFQRSGVAAGVEQVGDQFPMNLTELLQMHLCYSSVRMALTLP